MFKGFGEYSLNNKLFMKISTIEPTKKSPCANFSPNHTYSHSFGIFQNLPHDAYKLLAVPSPIGGVLVLCANTIHYHSQVI